MTVGGIKFQSILLQFLINYCLKYFEIAPIGILVYFLMVPAICPLKVKKSVIILNRDFKDWVMFIMDLLPFMFIMELLPILRSIYHPPSQLLYSVCLNDHK